MSNYWDETMYDSIERDARADAQQEGYEDDRPFPSELADE